MDVATIKPLLSGVHIKGPPDFCKRLHLKSLSTQSCESKLEAQNIGWGGARVEEWPAQSPRRLIDKGGCGTLHPWFRIWGLELKAVSVESAWCFRSGQAP